MDPLARLRSFPKAPSPNDDASAIRGNLTLEQKQLNANILAYHVQAGTTVFQSDVLKGLKLVEVNLRKKREGLGGDAQDTDALEGEMICEIEVTDNMLNVYRGMAGACFVGIFDVVTFGALFVLGSVMNIDPSGVSTGMDIKWYAPARKGMTVSIVATSIAMKGRIYSSEAEAYDKKTGQLLASIVHSVAPLRNLPPPPSQKTIGKL